MKMMRYPDLDDCELRYKELLAMEDSLILCKQDVQNRMEQIKSELKAIKALIEMQKNWQVIRCEG